MSEFQKPSQKALEFRQREEDILSCAQDLFLEQGEDKVTVEMIAEKVGIGKGTIYKHFETKSEIYLRLMIRYEEELAELFQSMDESQDQDRLARDYFSFRMKDPDRYALFHRLEQKLAIDNAVPELMEKLHRIRTSNADKLNAIITARIKEGKLEDVPVVWHICSSWALVHGAVALYHTDFYKDLIKDEDGFFEFLMDIGVRMGNKGRWRRKADSDAPEDED